MGDEPGRVLSFQQTEKGAEVVLSGSDPAAVAGVFDRFFKSNGFRLEQGSPLAGVYGRGNKIARPLVGGMVKREKYNVTITAEADSSRVTIASGMTGWSGSALGATREKKQRKALAEDLRAFLENQPDSTDPLA